MQLTFSGARIPLLRLNPSSPMRVGFIVALAVVAFHILPFAGKFGAYLATGRFLETDFQSFYYAADVAFNRGLSPYSLDVVRDFERAMGGVVYPFLYPPTALPWFFPFALFDFTTAVLLFQSISVACLVLVVLLLWREIVPRIESPAWQLTFVGALFVFEGISATLNWAQINLIVLAFIMVAWLRSAERGDDRLVAFCLFAAGALKTYPLLFLLVPLVRRRFGVIGWVAVFGAADLLVSLLVLPGGVWRDWLVNIAPTGGYGQLPFGLFSAGTAGNQNFNGLFIRILGEGEAARQGATIAALLCIVLAASAIFLARHLRDESFYGLSFGLVSVLTFLVAPLSWPHHYVYLLPALAWAAVQTSRLRLRRPGWLAARAALLASFVCCAYSWPIKEIDGLGNPLLRSAPLAGPVILFVLLLGLTIAASRGARSTPQGVRSASARLGEGGTRAWSDREGGMGAGRPDLARRPAFLMPGSHHRPRGQHR